MTREAKKTRKKRLVKFFRREYCDKYFYLNDEYFYLSREDADKSQNEVIPNYLHSKWCGQVQNIEGIDSCEKFIHIEINKKDYPEYFI